MQRILQPGEIESLDHTSFPRIQLPVPGGVFLDRASRLRQLAADSAMAPFLKHVADLAQAQHQVARSWTPVASTPTAADWDRAQRHAMPVWQMPAGLDANWRAALDALLARVRDFPGLDAALIAQLDALAGMDDQAVLRLLDAILMGAPLDIARRARAPYLMAAVQVVMTVQAAALDLAQMPYVDPPTVCPCCGSQPVASIVRIDGQRAGLRYLHCAICATEWHMVRVKCSNCASTKGISYRRMDQKGLTETVDPKASGPNAAREAAPATMAELCGSCGSYRKIFDLNQDHGMEPMADDLATLMLDILMGEEGHPRAGFNPFLYPGADDEQADRAGEASGAIAAAPGAGAPGVISLDMGAERPVGHRRPDADSSAFEG